MKITQQGFQQNLIGSTDDFRKRRMIVLVATAAWVMSFFSFLTVLYFKDPGETITQTLAYPEAFRLALTSFCGMFVSLLAILLTRVMKNTWLAGTLISAGLFVLIILADDFSEIAGGRSTFFFSIPIFISAITMGPSSTFGFAALTSLILFLRPGGITTVNVYAVPAAWILSLAIWLATSTMEKAIQTAQQETSRVRAMLGVVSHELRTPLGSISGYADLLLLDKGLAAIQAEMAARIKSSTVHLIDLVNRLLDSAYIQSGKLVLKPVSISIDSFFDTLAEQASRQAGEKGLEFIFQKGEIPAILFMDPLRLRQIVSNLTDNAIKYTKRGR